MTVRAVGQQDNGNSRLGTIIKSTAIGTAGGYAMKYLWPVTKQEDDLNRRVIINYSRKITNKAKAAEFRALPERTPAQDAFMKMIESGDKEVFMPERLKAQITELGGDKSTAGKEFKGIIRNVNEAASSLAKRFAISHKFTLKWIRPVVPFLVAGAGIGFFTGFTHNVMKTDYYA